MYLWILFNISVSNMGNKNIKGSKKSKNVKDDYQLKEQSKSFKIVIALIINPTISA